MAQESSSSSGGIAAMSQTESLVDWIVENKLKAIGYTWLTGIGGSLVRVDIDNLIRDEEQEEGMMMIVIIYCRHISGLGLFQRV